MYYQPISPVFYRKKKDVENLALKTHHVACQLYSELTESVVRSHYVSIEETMCEIM